MKQLKDFLYYFVSKQTTKSRKSLTKQREYKRTNSISFDHSDHAAGYKFHRLHKCRWILKITVTNFVLSLFITPIVNCECVSSETLR